MLLSLNISISSSRASILVFLTRSTVLRSVFNFSSSAIFSFKLSFSLSVASFAIERVSFISAKKKQKQFVIHMSSRTINIDNKCLFVILHTFNLGDFIIQVINLMKQPLSFSLRIGRLPESGDQRTDVLLENSISCRPERVHLL